MTVGFYAEVAGLVIVSYGGNKLTPMIPHVNVLSRMRHITGGKFMAEDIEELEKRLAELNRQHDEIVKKEIDELDKQLADLKRQREEIESSTSDKPECNITKKTEEKIDEECPACEFAAGIGMYLNVYRDLESEENCQDLFEKVTNGRITPNEFFNIIKEKAKDKPEKLDMLGYIDELMEEISDEGGSQEERV